MTSYALNFVPSSLSRLLNCRCRPLDFLNLYLLCQLLLFCRVTLFAPLSNWFVQVGLALLIGHLILITIFVFDFRTGGILFVIFASIGAFFLTIWQLAGLTRVLGLLKLRMRSLKGLSQILLDYSRLLLRGLFDTSGSHFIQAFDLVNYNWLSIHGYSGGDSVGLW